MDCSSKTTTDCHSDPDGDIFLSIVFKGQLYKVLKAAVHMGVFEVLEAHNSEGLTTGTFVKSHDFDIDNITTMLDALCYLKLVQRERNADGQWIYRNTRATQKYGIKGRQPSMIPLILQDDIVVVRKKRPDIGMFHSKKENNGSQNPEAEPTTTSNAPNQPQNSQGQPTNDMTNGQPGSHPNPTPTGQTSEKKWQEINVVKMLMMSMDGCLAPCVEAILSAFDLSNHRVVVDLGGGAGRLSVALKEKYPQMDITNFDQLPVCQFAPGYLGDKAKTIKYLPGDFFTDELPEADLYIVSHILHDWTEELGQNILTKVYKALIKGGTLLVLEKLLDSEKLEPEILISVNPIFTSNTLGIDIDEDSYRQRLTKAGFTGFQTKRIPGYNMYDVIMAKKPF